MLKRLTAIPKDATVPPLEEDKEVYGVWQEYSIKDELVADRKEHPVEPPPNIWPDWSKGRPSKFRLTYDWEPFGLGRAWHRWHKRTEALELEWNVPVCLSSIGKHPKALLPPDYSYAWSGVYRIFQPGVVIPRFLDQDPTGTLYVGKAGTKRNWSNLRTRVREAATRSHHVTQYWNYDNGLSAHYPWEALFIEWAFTGTRQNEKGKEERWANLAERWLLETYRQSFGEFPPLNER